jgi:hypothetical protein
MDALQLLKEAIKAVPSVKYALAVAGILAAASIAIQLTNNDWYIALLAAIGTLLLMVLMVVFARLSTAAPDNFKTPGVVLTWFALLLLMIWAGGLTTSVFSGWPIKGIMPGRSSDEGTSACASSPSSSEVVREPTAGEILSVMSQVPASDRRDEFKFLYKNKHIPLGGWVGTVDALPRFSASGVCSFAFLEDPSRARVLVSSCQRSCDYRKGDRARLFGWVKDYDVDEVEIVAERIDGVILPPSPKEPPIAPPPENKTLPPPQPAVVVYRICSGEYERNCLPHTMYQYCGFSVDGWAKQHCSSFSAQRLDTRDGNKCGYSLDQIICTGPK